MKLSIVIVNYNVKYFIEQCLHSVYKALHGIEAEVFVVDNNSVDGSCQMIREKFPQLTLIENKQNLGFSKANNQAMRIAQGEYVLLLNPDTVVQEDTFSKCIAFMDSHPEAGALGVKMIDGKGAFLPESKRALPTPDVAFYKIFGLSRLFPKSKVFGRYHLGFLDKDENHEIEILAGAYMFMRREALNVAGLLDEAFFMYGEDIDLSYRIVKAGYKNYYFADTTIIHYKGESTKKGSLNYVLVFYNAMIIFAKKHFSGRNFQLFSLLIHIAIYLRAALSIVRRFVKRIALPLADVLLILSGFFILVPFYESIKFPHGGNYPEYFLTVFVPLYVFLWVFGAYLSGAYDKPLRVIKLVRGIGIGTIAILVLYALLPADFHFSRLLIILGAIWSVVALTGFRYAMHLLGVKAFKISNLNKKRIVIVGEGDETLRVQQLLLQTQINPDILGYVSESPCEQRSDFLGTLEQLEDIVQIYQADEIIFCARNIPSQSIIEQMSKLSALNVEYKIAPPESLSIIGSNSIDTAGELYLININAINSTSSRREKRLFDFFTSLIVIVLLPVLIIFIKNRFRAILNSLLVLIGKRTWVGYTQQYGKQQGLYGLPLLKKGILNPVHGLKKKDIPALMLEKLDFVYAKDYKMANDFNILLKGLLHIGCK